MSESPFGRKLEAEINSEPRARAIRRVLAEGGALEAFRAIARDIDRNPDGSAGYESEVRNLLWGDLQAYIPFTTEARDYLSQLDEPEAKAFVAEGQLQRMFLLGEQMAPLSYVGMDRRDARIPESDANERERAEKLRMDRFHLARFIEDRWQLQMAWESVGAESFVDHVNTVLHIVEGDPLPTAAPLPEATVEHLIRRSAERLLAGYPDRSVSGPTPATP